MFDIPSSTATPVPPHWRTAALPQAQLCQLHAAGLRSLATGATHKISMALRQALQEPSNAGATLLIVDPATSPWRLRRLAGKDPGELWLLQSLDESRKITLRNFRSVCGAKLASGMLHELRDPLNALGLHCDLLVRTLKMPADTEALTQAAGRVAQMKERLRNLLERQNSMVGLWLSLVDDGPGPDLNTLVDETLRLLRSYGSQREVRLQSENLAALRLFEAPIGSVFVRIVLTAIGLLAIDSAALSAGPDRKPDIDALTRRTAARQSR
jgi:signal transduction histidine kinase